MDHRGARGPDGHGGDGAPPETVADAWPAPLAPAEPPPWVQPADGAYPATSGPPGTPIENESWALQWVTPDVRTTVIETDPPPWVRPEEQAGDPYIPPVDPAWAAYWASLNQPSATNAAPAAGRARNRSAGLLALLIGCAAILGIAILALAGYLVFGRGASSTATPTAAIAIQPAVQATNAPASTIAPTIVRPVPTASAPSAAVPVGTTAVATPSLAVRTQAPLIVPVVLPPTAAAAPSATSAPVPTAIEPPPAPTEQPVSAEPPPPPAPFVPQPALAVVNNPPPPVPTLVPEPTVAPAPTSPPLPTSPPPTPITPPKSVATQPPASTPAVLKTQPSGYIQPAPPRPIKPPADQG